ncbi:MAG: hypothetical protein WC718_15035 [Phycisphaerales bacterium]|jgi:hypothetical protein
MSIRRTNRVLGVVGAAGVVATLLGGCSSADSAQGIRDNLTPELQTMTDRNVDVRNRTSITFDENIRRFWEDMNRAALFDRPSMLSKYPTPY